MERERTITWPGWEVVRLIGRGGFGEVYEIRRNVFGHEEKAALKVITIPQSNQDVEELRGDGYSGEEITDYFQSFLKDIVREYALMSEMKGHTNIIYCDDLRYIQHDDGVGWDIYIKMELLTPLPEALGQQVSDEQVIRVGIDICNALLLCEGKNIIHRDIKPQNIFVSDDGNYKLGDFGIAKTVERTASGTRIGTYKYIAPEVYNNQPYGSAADVYSLGLVLYWMLNERRTPFLPLPPQRPTASVDEEARRRRLSGEGLPLPAHGSRALQQIVMKACAFVPKSRYTAEELKAALEALLSGGRAEAEACYADGDKTVCLWRGNNRTHVVEMPDCDAPETAAHTKAAKKKAKRAAPAKRRKIKYVLAACLALLVVTAVGVVLGLSQVFSGGSDSGTAGMAEPQPAAPDAEGWSDWVDSLPKGVNTQEYEIEDRKVYSYRTKDITSSTSKTKSGWTLYTSTGSGEFGPWSTWNENAVSENSNRQVETRLCYRYRDMFTTTSQSASLSGWELYDTTYDQNNGGTWSAWQTTPVYASQTRQIETKEQYRTRDLDKSTLQTSWSDWGSWQDGYIQSSSTVQVDTRTVYGYYYYTCPRCGAHMHGWQITCPTWAGGCGKGYIDRDDWHEFWSTTPHSSVSFSDWYGTGHYYAYVDGVLVFKWSDGMARGEATKTQYRSRDQVSWSTTEYGDWSSWGDSYRQTTTMQVESRTVYRYRDVQPTYHFRQWGAWSGWLESPISASDTRQVESKTLYRYKEKSNTAMYYFYRWSDWSDYSSTPVTESSDTEVRTMTQHRYKAR